MKIELLQMRERGERVGERRELVGVERKHSEARERREIRDDFEMVVIDA